MYSVEWEEAYMLILSDVNQVPDELIYANVFAKAIHGLLILDNEGGHCQIKYCC